MASANICLATGRRFNFSKYIFDSLIRNVDSSSKFYMYPRVLQLKIRAQVGKGFSGVETSLFKGMSVPQQAVDDVADVVANDVAADGVPAAAAEPTASSHPPTTTLPPPPQQEVTSTPPLSPHQSP
nr:synaptobrevin, longin-like domain protein [Tanacetum cinerariifolium]